MSFSERTESIISALAAEYSHGELTGLLKYASLGRNDPGPEKPNGSWNNKPTRVSAALGKNPSSESLIALATKILNDGAGGNQEWVGELRSSLLDDGYSLDVDKGKWSVAPIGAAEIPLSPQYSDLEAALTDKGFTVSANHYQQAFSAFKRQDWEACNASTRATVEGFFMEVATAKANFTPRPGHSNGTPAIEKLSQAGMFEPGEHDYVKGFWKMSHTNGSHPGLSSGQEALFRFSAATSALAFFIHRWTS